MSGRGTALVAVVLAVLAGCGAAADVRHATVIHPGRGEFTFDSYQPLSDRPVNVYYVAPPDPARAQVLIVMHGVARDSRVYRIDWEQVARDRNVLVLLPEFSEEYYPGSAAYNTGNVVDEDGDRLPRRQWTFNIVEALFDLVVRDVGSQATDYALFGHSAGAQFVHRFVEFMPRHRARVVVAANAGWYTMPDDSVRFPYGLDGSPVQEHELGPAFASNLVVMLGADDVNPKDESLRRDELSDRQGDNRLERGLAFFQSARTVAQNTGLPFRWRLHVVPGMAHDHAEAAEAAASFLLNRD